MIYILQYITISVSEWVLKSGVEKVREGLLSSSDSTPPQNPFKLERGRSVG